MFIMGTEGSKEIVIADKEVVIDKKETPTAFNSVEKITTLSIPNSAAKMLDESKNNFKKAVSDYINAAKEITFPNLGGTTQKQKDDLDTIRDNTFAQIDLVQAQRIRSQKAGVDIPEGWRPETIVEGLTGKVEGKNGVIGISFSPSNEILTGRSNLSNAATNYDGSIIENVTRFVPSQDSSTNERAMAARKENPGYNMKEYERPVSQGVAAAPKIGETVAAGMPNTEWKQSGQIASMQPKKMPTSESMLLQKRQTV